MVQDPSETPLIWGDKSAENGDHFTQCPKDKTPKRAFSSPNRGPLIT